MLLPFTKADATCARYLLFIELIHEDITFESLSIFKSVLPGIQGFDKIPEFPVY